MSALPPKADIAEGGCHVRYVPIADIRRANCSRGALHGFGGRTQSALVKLILADKAFQRLSSRSALP